RGQGGGGLRRDAGRRDSACAGRDLPGECAQVQRRVSGDAPGGRRCENAWRVAGAAAFAQRTDADDEGTRLRQGLPLSARFRGRAGRAELFAGRTGRKDILRAVRARIRNQDPRVSCARARGTQRRVAAQAGRERLTGKKRTAKAGPCPFPRFTKVRPRDYFVPRTESFSALAAVKRSLVRAGILIS